eukprot:m.239022 g.239022  ORF g.239022 m.239022 type:complete len:103 (+) comp40174_c0_seq52:489-797(+)
MELVSGLFSALLSVQQVVYSNIKGFNYVLHDRISDVDLWRDYNETVVEQSSTTPSRLASILHAFSSTTVCRMGDRAGRPHQNAPAFRSRSQPAANCNHAGAV